MKGRVRTALEAGELDLQGTLLLVLSTCNSGLGKAAGGEGVLGMQRAFLIASVRTTLTCLRKIDDEDAYQLMCEFYKRLWDPKKPVGTLEALRQAQLWMLDPKNGSDLKVVEDALPRSPYHWAAVVLSGDWR